MFKTCQFEHVKVKGSKSSGMTIVLPSFWGSVKQYMHIYIIIYTMQQNHGPAQFRFSSYDLLLRWLWHVTSSKHIKTRVLHPPFQRCKQKVAQTSGVRQTCRSKGWDKKNTHKYRHLPTIQASLRNPYSMYVKSQLVLDACHPLFWIESYHLPIHGEPIDPETWWPM